MRKPVLSHTTRNTTVTSSFATPIPLNDPKRQLDEVGGAIAAAVNKVVASGSYALGSCVATFEEEFAHYCGVRHCIGVANGTDALELALRALGCGPESEIVTVANAGMYASAAILAVRARPVFADIEPESMTLCPSSLSDCFSPRTRAVVVTHLYGRFAQIEDIIALARRHEVPVIEDCAQAHGAEWNGKKAGSFGQLGCFSFYPTKNLGALGDAGALITDDEGLAKRIRSLRQYGWETKYHARLPYGRNSRMDEIQAAILCVKLPYLDDWNRRRREIIRRYRHAAGKRLRIPDTSKADHAAHLCVVRHANRAALREALFREGISTDIHYPVPDHRQDALRKVLDREPVLPVTERVAGEILSIPCFPELKEEEVAHICRSLARFGEAIES